MDSETQPKTDTDVDRLADIAIDLGKQVVELQERVGAAETVGALETRTGAIEKANTGIKRLVAFGLILTLALGGLFYRVDQNSQNVARLQDVVSKDVLCPVFKLASASYDPNRFPGEPDKQKQYNDGFKVLEKSYKALGCK